MLCIELHDSRKLKGDPTTEAALRFAVLQCQDEQQALGAVYAKAPTSYLNLSRNPELTTTEKSGYDSFVIELTYDGITVEGPEGGGGGGGDSEPARITEFDTTGGTQHITQALSTTAYPTNDLTEAIRKSKAIGVTRNGVDGVDVVIPKLEFTIKRKIKREFITGAYIKSLSRMTGKKNAAPYSIDGEDYEIGELLFMGGAGTIKDDEDKPEIAFKFSASENRQAIPINDTVGQVNTKQGHDYLWCYYEKAGNQFVEEAQGAFVSVVYETANFKGILGF